MKPKPQEILEKLPYAHPFLFVDAITLVQEDRIEGNYTFRSDLPFYEGHFKGNPITPGVILTECCAQIGLVCLGISLWGGPCEKPVNIAMTSSEMEYLAAVLPDEKVRVTAKKIYFRFNKLKCSVKMYNQEGVLVCSGVLAGMLLNNVDEK